MIKRESQEERRNNLKKKKGWRKRGVLPRKRLTRRQDVATLTIGKLSYTKTKLMIVKVRLTVCKLQFPSPTTRCTKKTFSVWQVTILTVTRLYWERKKRLSVESSALTRRKETWEQR
ncbi:hypothetical protein DPMN_079331 [Dreissena polymorpha]|uniref:Uncharacterized protein n=1 Tax=Dreissena polymorpha TaxID=45954 RepID=A0A9D3YSE0_DREPO|nr:hypothetical protein DPMN_079331 [Dreissena polymorpha]